MNKLLLSVLIAPTLFAAAPAINSVQNPASNILSGLPNYGIAEGSLFILYGTDLGPTSLVQAGIPLPTILPATNGVQVKITQKGIVYNAPILYVLNTQVAAVMPSNVPAGSTATIQVIYNGVAGNSFPTSVVVSNFGISTANQSGGGRAVVTDASYNVMTPTTQRFQARPTRCGVLVWGQRITTLAMQRKVLSRQSTS